MQETQVQRLEWIILNDKITKKYPDLFFKQNGKPAILHVKAVISFKLFLISTKQNK